MNESEFKKYKIELKKREKSSSKTLWLVVYACFIYLLFGSFNICGKFFLTCSYIYSFSSNYQQEYNYKALTLANIQQYLFLQGWFFFQLAGPFSLPFIPDLIGKLKFRFILLIASLGPILFLTPAPFASSCKNSDATICDLGFIYSWAIVASIIAGLMQSVLLFSALFYISNLALGQEKVIYYVAFFFIHTLQWLLGSLLGEIFLTYDVNNSQNTIVKVFILLIILQFAVSILYLTLPEQKEGRYFRFSKAIYEFFNQRPQKQQKQTIAGVGIRELLLSNAINEEKETEEDTFKINKSLENSKSNKSISDLHFFKSAMVQNQDCKSIITLQCFSIEEKSLKELMDCSELLPQNNVIQIEEYQNKSYFAKLYLTWQKLYNDQFQYIFVLLGFIACIQAFLFIYFFPFFAYPGSKDLAFQIRLVLQGYLYVGVGELFGSFLAGMLGDYKDKLNALVYVLFLFQFGCIVAWTSYIFEYEILVLIFSCSTGFCDSALTSSVISVMTLKYPKHIYLVDLMYFFYSISFSVIALVFISCNDTDTFISLILLQVFGLVGIYAICKINTQIKDDKHSLSQMKAQINF